MVGIYKHQAHQGFQKGCVFTEEHKLKLSLAKTGKRQSSETIEKRRLKLIGRTAWNKGMKEGNGNAWKGCNVGYSGLHRWVKKHMGIAEECVYCGKESCQGRIEWANVSQKYLRNLSDFISLCVSCHRKYDYNFRKTQ